PSTAAAKKAEIAALLSSGERPEEIRVVMEDGIYAPQDFVFSENDCSADVKVTWTGSKNAILMGGMTFPRDQWQRPDADMASRFAPNDLPNIYMIPLAQYGLHADDWGELMPLGAFHTARLYDGAKTGTNCEFFCGGRRMILARYPNAGSFDSIRAVLDMGEVVREENKNKRNPRGGTYIVFPHTNARISRWRDPSTAWIFGYFMYEWADASSPITVRPKYQEFDMHRVAPYGVKPDAKFYLYNVPEELDAEGEWYLDRKTGNLYFWPWEGAEEASFSFRHGALLQCKGVRNMAFTGFTITCGIDGAITAECEDTLFSDLTVTNIYDNAIVVDGKRNTVYGCHLERLGSAGIVLKGGDAATLTEGQNRAENNLIRDFAQVNQMYRPGISIGGVGNAAVHNEICNAPHSAIIYGGNCHVIEYNDIHDVCLQSSDAGAIYAGRDHTAFGTVIRYNRLVNLGSGEYKPQGIYWDDTLCGQTAYGNIIVNVGNWGFQVGGGRWNRVENNLIVNAGAAALEYDSRLRDGMLFGGWYPKTNWDLHAAQYAQIDRFSEPWISRFPQLAATKIDRDCDPDDPDYFINPSYSRMCNNVAISAEGALYALIEESCKFSLIDDNHLYRNAEAIGWDSERCCLSDDSPVYREHPAFERIPVEKIGLYKK
ncbi:MAG: right-handed parallel beta-helix repeat-containing protein, partial [Clostridia bacterium]|nr:right-handed parallel beta-helix repeat-containing protein [Clostridia bacterium]